MPTPTASGFYQPTNAAKWIDQKWAKFIERAPYFRGVMLTRATEFEPLHGQFHLPQMGTFTPTSVSSTTDMTHDGLVFSANTETEYTISPSTIILATSVNDNVMERAASDPKPVLRESFEMAMGQKVDQDIFSLFDASVLGASGGYGSVLDKSTILNVQARIEKNAKEYADDGQQIYFAFAPENGPAVRSTSDFVNAYIRGDGQNPAVSGRVVDAFGISFVPSGNVRTNAGATGYNNGMWIKKGIGFSFNIRPRVEVQRRGLGWWILAEADYGYGTVRDAYIGNVKSTIPVL